jgi:K+-transporting ATPase ATPase B chain
MSIKPTSTDRIPMTAPAALAPARKKAASLTDPKLLRAAVIESFTKLDPRVQRGSRDVRGSWAILTTLACAQPGGFNIKSLWLWFTVLFANSPKPSRKVAVAQTATLRKMRTTTMARRLKGKTEEKVAAGELHSTCCLRSRRHHPLRRRCRRRHRQRG